MPAAAFVAVLGVNVSSASSEVVRAGTSPLFELRSSSSVRGPSLPAAPFRPGVVLLGFRPGVSPGQRHAIEQAVGGDRARRLGPAIRPVGRGRRTTQEYLSPLQLRVPSTQVLAAVRRLRRNPAVAYAEPDYLMQASAIEPDDPSFPLQWGSDNDGQQVPFQEASELLGGPSPGIAGDDDGALAAWQLSTGSRSIVIGEADTGVEYTHPDLAANIWSNPGGIGGCAAGTHGYNVLAKTCDPMDDDTAYDGHGTHVAGIIGAVGNNGIGVAGMNWQTTILPVKWMNSASSGETSGLIEALQWLVAAKQAGVNIRVVNDSATFSGTAFSQALSNEIDTLGANNILFVTAAGNSGNDDDEVAVRRYPCGYDRPTEICVTASNDNDELPSWANYGPKTVDLAAPGVSIYSTLRGGSYGYLSGGSMASPQVAGTAGLILSLKPSLSATELKADIVENVDKAPGLAGRVISGGTLDVCKALPGCERQWPRPAPPTGTFGKTSVGADAASDPANLKGASRYTLPYTGSVSKLSIYLQPSGSSGQQTIEGVIYADSSGTPGALLGTTSALTFKSTNAAGWYELGFPTALKLAAGNYWIGFISAGTADVVAFRYDTDLDALDYNANTYSSGPSNPFGTPTVGSLQISIYATYTTSVPTSRPSNTALPAISGTTQQGQTLSASTGSWSEEPTSYAYQWTRCESTGLNCSAIIGASAQTYTPVSADVGSTLRVEVTATNERGASSPAISEKTALVTQGTATFGDTSVGAFAESDPANLKGAGKYALPVAGSVSKLSLYLQPTSTSGQQTLDGVLYADSSGTPSALLGTTSALTFKSTNAAGWYELSFPTPLKLAAGNYWIGWISAGTADVAAFRYESVSGALDYNANAYTSGPSNPFGTPTVIGDEPSIYATYAPE